MRDRELYGKILGIESPWMVEDVRLDVDGGEVEVWLGHGGPAPLECPECGRPLGAYDSRQRRWRHLDTCQYRTILVARVPRVSCPEHGVRQVRVPWAESGSRFTALFEALVIDWLKEASILAVARQLRLSWDQADGIMSRAVRRGLARRPRRLPKRLGVDETSFQKRHEYVTIVSGLGGEVVHVADGRDQEALSSFYEQFERGELADIETVAMDMWEPYIRATHRHIPDAETKIAFDKFHVASHLGDAVDKVRRQENKKLMLWGDQSLRPTRYLWLQHPANITDERWASFKDLRESALKTARAWAIKEEAMMLWNYKRRGWAAKAWKAWYSWAIRSRLEPVKTVARMVKRHLSGILNAIVHGVTNARAEGVNSVVQWIKYTARGFRNRDRFRTAIYFHLGGLNLYPDNALR